MLKSNPFKVCLLIPAIVFCLNLSGVSAEPCTGPDCPRRLSTMQGTVQYPADWLLEWDPTNPQAMDRDSSVTVKIIGGVPPYSWSVSGSGFDLAYGVTQGLSNSLLADGTACGSAGITVIDSRNAMVSGHVRCSSSGKWQFISNTCELAGLPADEWIVDNIGSWLNYIYPNTGYVIVGHQKQTQKQDWVVNAGSPGSWDDEADCEQARYTGCGASYSGPCLAYPSSLEFNVPGGSYKGHYDRCLDTRRYPRECTENIYGDWSYVSAWIRTTNYSIKYYEWTCP